MPEKKSSTIETPAGYVLAKVQPNGYPGTRVRRHTERDATAGETRLFAGQWQAVQNCNGAGTDVAESTTRSAPGSLRSVPLSSSVDWWHSPPHPTTS